jgi:solute carrier family 10 (sodium/bile acid cotransporter), member 7
MLQMLKKNWFMFGLVAIAFTVVLDFTGIVVDPGLWLKNHHGPDAVIVLIFILSGLALDIRQIKEGVADIKGTSLALCIIFLVAPVIAYFFSLLPIETGLILGIFLVATMPTTLSSGVVMTGSAGGNMAHSLLITIVANSLAVITIPISLALLIGGNENQVIQIDQFSIIVKIASLVLCPLMIGMVTRRLFSTRVRPILAYTSTCNQIGILAIVWMALCGGRNAIVSSLDSIILIIIIVFFFHLLLVLAAFWLTKVFKIAKGRRESVIFMGGQKTLALSVILQVSLFPEFGLALVFCVVHHIVHLIMDAYLVNYLKATK